MERRHFLAAISQVAGLRYADIADLDCASVALFTMSDFLEAGLNQRLAAAVAKAVRDFDIVNWEERLVRHGCQAMIIGEPLYPLSLVDIYAPPLVLYCRGSLSQYQRVAVVGTRAATHYGRQVVETFVPLLVSAEHSIVSGLARGIDTYAHQAAIKLGGHTIAVFGCGLDTIYPRDNKLLAMQIVESGGAICSEYALGTPPLPHHFPARNRIISGLSRACLVVEGNITSGALITALHALEQGRDVLAVPGNIFSPQSRGPNHLISQGATPLTDPTVLLQTLGLTAAAAAVAASSEGTLDNSPEASAVLAALGAEALSADELMIATGRPIASLLAILSELEIAGVVLRVPTGEYICHRPKLLEQKVPVRG